MQSSGMDVPAISVRCRGSVLSEDVAKLCGFNLGNLRTTATRRTARPRAGRCRQGREPIYRCAREGEGNPAGSRSVVVTGDVGNGRSNRRAFVALEMVDV